MLRAEVDELRSLPVTDAAQLIKAKRAEQEQRSQPLAERERQISDPFEHNPHRRNPRRNGPTRGL